MAATSNRQYLSQSELAEYANITIIDETEADDRISQAEELIDAYVGFQDKALHTEVMGKATAGGSTSLTLQTKHQNIYEADYFTYCYVEIIGGTGAGQRVKITSSTKAGVLTTSAFSTSPDSTSVYRIYQLGKFPRYSKDTFYNSEETPTKWYKFIPEEVKRATAAQIEYVIDMGENYFSSDATDKTRERLDDYEYEKDKPALTKLIAPKARQLLKQYVNRVGKFE